MGGWRFLCGVLWLVQLNALALAQTPDVPEEESPTSESEEPAAVTDPPSEPGVTTDAEVEGPTVEGPAVEDADSNADIESDEVLEGPTDPVEPAVTPLPPVTGLEFRLQADRPGRLRFESADGEEQEFRAPGRATLEATTYQVSWVPSGGSPELLQTDWQPNGEAVRVAHRGPSFTNLLGYWLFGNGLLVGIPVSAGVFAKRDDLGAAATFSIIGVNTLVAIAGAILMGAGDDEVIELESN